MRGNFVPVPKQTPTGEPGPAYWQNRADYALRARLDANTRRLTASGTITDTAGQSITVGGQIITSVMMLIGYSIIAVPTGIVIGAMQHHRDPEPPASGRSCPECSLDGHRDNAKHCWNCGAELDPAPEDPG